MINTIKIGCICNAEKYQCVDCSMAYCISCLPHHTHNVSNIKEIKLEHKKPRDSYVVPREEHREIPRTTDTDTRPASPAPKESPRFSF